MVDTKVTDRPKKKLDKKLLVACLSVAGVIILGLLIFFVIKVASNKPETGSPTDTSEDLQDDYEEASPSEEIPEEVAKLRPGDIEKIGKSQYVAEDVKYIDALIDHELYETASVELEGYLATVDLSYEEFSDCELASVYDRMLKLEEATKKPGEEATDYSEPETDPDDPVAPVIQKFKAAKEACRVQS